jgi:hypothetical protein
MAFIFEMSICPGSVMEVLLAQLLGQGEPMECEREDTIGSDRPGSSHINEADKTKGDGAAAATGQQKYHTVIL